MKKLILSAVVAAGAMFGAYTANQANDFAFSDLQIENIEALGDGGDSAQGVCSYGMAEYYVNNDPKYNRVHGYDCGYAHIVYQLAHINCKGEKLCSDSAWFTQTH